MPIVLARKPRTGVQSFRAIASALNARGIPTARDGQWHDSTVRNALKHAIGLIDRRSNRPDPVVLLIR